MGVVVGDAGTGDRGGRNGGRSLTMDDTDTRDDEGTAAILATLDRSIGGKL